VSADARIPFNRPSLVGRELAYIEQAVREGRLANKGRFTHACRRWLEEHTGAARVVLTHSCTAALEIAALLCDLEPEDEVVMPAFTFVSTANAFRLRGAALRFVDIRPDTLNLDERLVADAVGPRTRVLVPVHYAGVGAEMDALAAIAARHGLVVVEDAAQALGATFHGRPLGAIGHLGAYSFHETKNVSAGQGGALVVNDPRFVERAEILAEKGTDRERFFRGEVDRYTWTDLGSSFLASELTAAFLCAQLEEADAISARRHAIFTRYEEGLASLAARGAVRLPTSPAYCRHNAHLFHLVLADAATSRALAVHLDRAGVHAVRHYVPLHLSPMGRGLGYRPGDLPITEDLAERLLRLPYYYELAVADQARVIAAVRSFFDGGSAR
jgi:dTDP-4-amino-4,6-dideoxygalactose transaminase